MKKFIFATLLIALGVAGSLIYTSKPEAKAASTKSFAINLKDGRVTANDNGFGRFNEWNSGPLGRATDDDLYCMAMFPGQRNWNSALSMYLECFNDRMGPYKKEYFYLNATGYDVQGHSSGTWNVKSSLEGDHWRTLCMLKVINLNYTPMTSRDAITPTNMWRVYGLLEEFPPYTVPRDTLYIDGDKPAIANRVRVTGNSTINFDVKILPVKVLMPNGNGTTTPLALYRNSVAR